METHHSYGMVSPTGPCSIPTFFHRSVMDDESQQPEVTPVIIMSSHRPVWIRPSRMFAPNADAAAYGIGDDWRRKPPMTVSWNSTVEPKVLRPSSSCLQNDLSTHLLHDETGPWTGASTFRRL